MTALFLMVPAYGHLNATFRLARQLETDGYRILYAYFGESGLAEHIKQQGFGVYWLQSQPFGIGLDEALNRGRSESYLEILIDRFTGRDFRTRTDDLRRIVVDIQPTLILLDAFLSTDFIILYPLLKGSHIKVVIIQTMLSTYDDGIVPPINTALIPGQDSPQLIRKAWKRFYRNRALWRVWEDIKHFGQSSHRLVGRKFRQNNLPTTHRLLDDKLFHVGFDNLPEWIMAPREFDFPDRKVLPNQKYLGLTVDLNRIEYLPAAYMNVMNQIMQERQTNLDLKLLYVSLGTVKGAHVKLQDILHFFGQLFAAVETQSNWRAIIAVGPELNNSFTTCPSNVYVLTWVPQLHLLQQCDLFITHGGLNSVLESRALSVPMLVYPLNLAWDQMGNAARIVSQGIGLMGNLQSDTATDISLVIKQLLTRSETKTKFS